MQTEQESDDDEEIENATEVLTAVSSNTALEALQTLRNFYEVHNIEDSFFKSYCNMKKIVEEMQIDERKKNKQTCISDYFK